MKRNIFMFVFGLVTGVALIHILEGPLDYQLLRREAGEAINEAGKASRDLRLAATVRTALALQKDFALFGGITVDAEEGEITLGGTVGSDDQRKLAELITRGVDGVEAVTNRLRVHVPEGGSSERP